jgi:CTP:molybdopterin cytidylyltransferase MocA
VTVAAVVLAAGAGERFTAGHGAGKLCVPFRGRPLVAWAVGAAWAAGFDETVVVVGAGHHEVVTSLRNDLVGLGTDDGPSIVVNDRWATGMASSLQAAIAHAHVRGHDCIVVGLGDQPLVPPEAWTMVRDAPADPPITVATFAGVRCPPVRLPAAVWALAPVTGDEGMRTVMRLRPDLVGEIPCPGRGADIDTWEDLERWS